MSHCNHKECEHELKFCKCYNVVYCVKCKKEWKENVYGWWIKYPTYTYPVTQPYFICTTSDNATFHAHTGEIKPTFNEYYLESGAIILGDFSEIPYTKGMEETQNPYNHNQ